MTRPRRPGSRSLPPNLYRRTDLRNGRIYYAYRDRRNGRFHGLGTDEAAAIADAEALNAAITQQIASTRAAQIAQPQAAGPLFADVIRRHLEVVEGLHVKGKLAASTLKGKRGYCSRLQERFHGRTLGSITVRDLAALLDEHIQAGHERTAQALRSEMIEVWKTAMAEGWATDNTAALTRPPTPQVQRARLTLEVFLAIYERTESAWLRNAMALAIVTAQRREDIALAQFADVRDGGWWVVQGKTGSRVFLPLELRLDAVGLTLADVVRQCRATGVVSRYLVHQVQPFGNSPVGAAIWKDTISRAFRTELDALGMDWSGKHRPSFHEIRSLAIRLYAAQGDVRTQDLAAHKDPRTTSVYEDGRGEWVRVKQEGR